MEGSGDELREELVTGQRLHVRRRRACRGHRSAEGCSGSGCSRGRPRTGCRPAGSARRPSPRAPARRAPSSPLVSAVGSDAERPAIISEKKMPIDSELPAFRAAPAIPDADPRSDAGTLFMIDVRFGALNRPDPMPFRPVMTRELPVLEVHRDEQQRDEGRCDEQQADRREAARAEPVGERAGDRARDEEADGDRQQVDARPERRVLVASSRAAAARCPAAR